VVPTLEDGFDMILPKMKPGGIMLCHAVGFKRGGMGSFVEYIENDPRLETFIIPMSRPGISLTLVRSVSIDE
jgi:predicted O-methyltransferase YrrM